MMDDNKLKRWWSAIIKQYGHKSEQRALQDGPGINIFNVLEQPELKVFNCKYYYAQKDTGEWDIALNNLSSEFKTELDNKYDPDTMFVVCLILPRSNDYKSMGSVKLFKFETKEDIDFEKVFTLPLLL